MQGGNSREKGDSINKRTVAARQRFHLNLEESSGCHQLPGQSSHFWYPRLVGSRTARKLVENATNFPTCDLKSILAAPLAPLQTNSHQQTLHTLLSIPQTTTNSSHRYTTRPLPQHHTSQRSTRTVFKMAPAVGIDLGTTYSCVGVFREDRYDFPLPSLPSLCQSGAVANRN